MGPLPRLDAVRVRRGADASSDHHLVTAKVTLKLRTVKPNKYTMPRYDFSTPQEPGTRNAFVLQLRNMFQASSYIDERDNEEEDTVNQQCLQVRNLYEDAEDQKKAKN